MSGEPWKYGVPIPQPNHPEFNVVSGETEPGETSDDHHRRERKERMRERINETEEGSAQENG